VPCTMRCCVSCNVLAFARAKASIENRQAISTTRRAMNRTESKPARAMAGHWIGVPQGLWEPHTKSLTFLHRPALKAIGRPVFVSFGGGCKHETKRPPVQSFWPSQPRLLSAKQSLNGSKHVIEDSLCNLRLGHQRPWDGGSGQLRKTRLWSNRQARNVTTKQGP
jgi:hypothetical protein